MPQPSTGYMPPPYPTSSYMPTSGGFSGYPPYPPSSNPSFRGMPTFPTPYPPYPNNNFGVPPTTPASTGTIKDEHIRESLLTAIEEKLMRRMKEQFQQNQAELETLKRTQEELKQGKAKLDVILGKLEKEKVLSSSVTLFSSDCICY